MPKARCALGHIFSADIELVGWGKFIQRWVPFGSRIGFVLKHKSAGLARNRYWRAPWIKFCFMNDLEDTRDPKVVIANSGRASRVALEFQGCCLQRSETVGERNERVCVFFLHCLSHSLLGRGQRADAGRASQVRMDVRDPCVRTRTTS